MKPLRIAILGATSHIAKGLIKYWSGQNDRELLLYARSSEQVRAFLGQLGNIPIARVYSIEAYGLEQHDVVINCIGFGGPQKLNNSLGDIFRLTTMFDDSIINYLEVNPDTIYVNLSSGAAYGADFSQPVNEQSQARFNINDLKAQEFYGISKLHSEARHRALRHLNIIDVRIFGYFSRYIDLNEKFLLSEIISCVKNKEVFVTSPTNILRDYLHPYDLSELIDCCIENCPMNDVFDSYSAKEVNKFELLGLFSEIYGLQYKIDDSYQLFAVTGTKDYYYPVSRKASKINYIPRFSSIEAIDKETSVILGY